MLYLYIEMYLPIHYIVMFYVHKSTQIELQHVMSY